MKPAISIAIMLALAPLMAGAQDAHEPHPYDPALIHAPTPLPDRVVLTWAEDPATTQSVTWRTDTSVTSAVAEIAVANANGRALMPARFEAETTSFKSDLNEANYHTLTFHDLQPDTLYAYRVGDGVNWSEYYHFRTASDRPQPFSFIYFGDAQNEIRTHWSRVFREAFREAPRAAFTVHAGDLINQDALDAEWGEWHGAPAWVNGTIPVIAAPGNHEYYRANEGPENERFWNDKNGKPIAVDVAEAEEEAPGGGELHKVTAVADGRTAHLEYDDDDRITRIDDGVTALTGFTDEELLGTKIDGGPLRARLREQGIPMVSDHWRPQFSFPMQDVPKGLEETVYYVDYQGTRIIALDSNKEQEAQVEWLRKVLRDNPNRWTILTFHHPMFSPAADRDNAALRALWKPVFDEFKVDLVLTGHDHTYARTGQLESPVGDQNYPAGYQQAYDPAVGTVYVVSVSGPKMYDVTKSSFAKRMAEDTQLYQVVEVHDDELKFSAYTATGELYDAFTLEKREGQPNRLRELLPPENRKTVEQ